jgi:hypothetical protein
MLPNYEEVKLVESPSVASAVAKDGIEKKHPEKTQGAPNNSTLMLH